VSGFRFSPGLARSTVAESEVVAHAAQLEEALDDRWAGNDGEVVTVRAGMSIGVEDEMKTAGVHELQPAQIKDQTFKAGVSQLRESFGHPADRGHVEFAAGHDAHNLMVWLDVNPKRREPIPTTRGVRSASADPKG
jgi:hypothetical protein